MHGKCIQCGKDFTLNHGLIPGHRAAPYDLPSEGSHDCRGSWMEPELNSNKTDK